MPRSNRKSRSTRKANAGRKTSASRKVDVVESVATVDAVEPVLPVESPEPVESVESVESLGATAAVPGRQSESVQKVESIEVTAGLNMSELIEKAVLPGPGLQDTSQGDTHFVQTPIQASPPAAEVVERLDELLRRFDQLNGRLDEFPSMTAAPPIAATIVDHDELIQLREELEQSWRNLEETQRDNDELRLSNQALTEQIARTNANRTVHAAIGVDESLSWEERKSLMMAQMEDDSFDANEFIESLSDHAKQIAAPEIPGESDEETDPPTPHQFVESLVQRVDELREAIRDRDQEIGELKILLQNQSNTWQSETRDSGIAIGAAAIASLIDGDALVIEERQRLQQLKDDWEDKFRQTEIEASLERAKLSRERQELAKRTRELEERLEEVQREKRTEEDPPVKRRRWLAELGISSNES